MLAARPKSMPFAEAVAFSMRDLDHRDNGANDFGCAAGSHV
jgi:hypothetical protein